MAKDIVFRQKPNNGGKHGLNPTPSLDSTVEAPKELSGTLSEPDIQKYYRALHTRCGEILEESIAAENGQKVARSHQFFRELELWCHELSSRSEAELLRTATYEYQFGLLALCQGNYRQAFKSLRLVLELALQSTHLSANELELREWLANRKDTVWATITNAENGIFSARFARAFFPEVEGHISYHLSMAQQVYRECSECVHGNMPKHIPLPEALNFSQESFDLWHAKAHVVALVGHFALCMRNLLTLKQPLRDELETVLLDRVGHIQEIRVKIGGVAGG